jgi:hypothetical protein
VGIRSFGRQNSGELLFEQIRANGAYQLGIYNDQGIGLRFGAN